MSKTICLSALLVVILAPLTTFAEQPTQKLPKVLIIGDSISIGYTNDVKKLLAGKADVQRIRGNGQHTTTGVAKIDAWLGEQKWDVIHFNWGLWDLCYRHPESKVQGRRDKVNGTLTTTLADYETNLKKIVARLKKTDAKLIWAATTPVPADEAGRIQGDAVKYNAVAKKIMDASDIAIDDLHSHILPQQAKYQTAPGNVHFVPAGSRFLAEKVAESILQQLSDQK